MRINSMTFVNNGRMFTLEVIKILPEKTRMLILREAADCIVKSPEFHAPIGSMGVFYSDQEEVTDFVKCCEAFVGKWESFPIEILLANMLNG